MQINIPDIMGKSPKILRVLRDIRKISPQDAAVMISGEKGRYKELIARAIHDNSPRSRGPFVTADLTSIPRELTKGELFGKEGTIESAGQGNGRVGEANGGTFFIEDISELEMELQDMFFRLLEVKDAGTPGQNGHLDVRVICTTCRNLKDAVQKGLFRKDLYEMLCKSQIKVPFLRERREDILPLAQYFLDKTVERFETGEKEFSKEAEDFLVKYDWPGDVRQLEDMVKRAAILSPASLIDRRDLVLWDVNCCSIKEFLEEKLKRYLKEMMQLENSNLYGTVLSEVEKSLVTMVLEETGGNQLKAAKTLGINRNTLRAKVKAYKIRL